MANQQVRGVSFEVLVKISGQAEVLVLRRFKGKKETEGERRRKRAYLDRQ